LKGSCGFTFGNGCSDGASAPSLFNPKKKGAKAPVEA
jgi:nitrate reductase beta subunit